MSDSLEQAVGRLEGTVGSLVTQTAWLAAKSEKGEIVLTELVGRVSSLQEDHKQIKALAPQVFEAANFVAQEKASRLQNKADFRKLFLRALTIFVVGVSAASTGWLVRDCSHGALAVPAQVR